MKQSNSRELKTPEQKKVILKAIAEHRRAGMTMDQAREKEGVGHAQYYSWRKALGKNSSKPRMAQQKVVNFTIPESATDQMVILIGSQTHVTAALAQLNRIQGRA